MPAPSCGPPRNQPTNRFSFQSQLDQLTTILNSVYGIHIKSGAQPRIKKDFRPANNRKIDVCIEKPKIIYTKRFLVDSMLERILGSKSKIRIFRFLFRNPENGYSMEDIVKATGMSYGTVHPAMQDLVESRIIVTRKIGRSNVYKINQTHILFPQVKALLNTEATAFRDKAEEFADRVEKKGVENIILFGSVARGEVIEAGDIDLLFIYTDPTVTEKIDILVMEFLEKYDIVISPIFLSKKETLERIKNLDGFVLRTIDEGKILHGDDAWLKK